ncbi:unnamed protein product, partial [Allacma fusca]
ALQGVVVSGPNKDSSEKKERRKKKANPNESNDEKLNRFMLLETTD